MKKAIVAMVVGMMVGGAAFAQTPAPTPQAQSPIQLSNLTGLQVLKTVQETRGVREEEFRGKGVAGLEPLTDSVDRGVVEIRLCLRVITYNALKISANVRVPVVLVNRAALEAATCRSFSTFRVQNFLNSGVITPINTVEDLANQIRRPTVTGGVTADDGTALTPAR